MNTPSQGLPPGTSRGEIILGGGPDPLRFLWTTTQSMKCAKEGRTRCFDYFDDEFTCELRLGPEVLGPLGGALHFELLQACLRRAVDSWPAPAPFPSAEYDRVIWGIVVPELDLSVRTGMDNKATVQLRRTSADFQRNDFLRWARSVAQCLERIGSGTKILRLL